VEPELFWAARGGGRGLGVVTSFEFALHPIGPEVAAATVFYPYEDAGRIARAWREVAVASPETVAPELALWSVPPDPAIPAELHGQKVVIVAALHAGPADDPAASAALAPFCALGEPLVDATGTVPYVGLQSAQDPLFPTGGRYYMKSLFLDELSDAVIDTMIDHDARRPTPESLVVVRTLGGAIARVGSDESAFAHRSATFNLSVDAGWVDPSLDDTAIGWARGLWDAVAPHGTGGVYVNFSGLDDDVDDLHAAAFAGSNDRLERIRRVHDPDGLFAPAARRS
jgi:FAD/FMN-containing dehydrogenase